MSDILRFDIAGARKEFGDKKTYDYLRNNLQSNVNWDLFDKEFTDNIAQGLDVLEQSQLSISGKIPQSYNVHTQARNTLGEDIPTELKEVEHKNSLLETLHTLGEGALDILDVKPLVNPILKSTIGTEIPDNVLQSDERRQYLSDVRDNIKYKLANNMPLDSDEIHRLKLDEGVLDSLKDKSLTNKLNEAFLNNNTGKDPLQVYNEVIAKEYKDKQEIFNTDNYTDLSDAQKEIIDRDTGVFDKIEQYVSDATPDERLAHYKESKLEENITKKTTEALIWLENTDPHTDIFSLISKLGGGEEDSKKRVAYLNRVESIAQAAGFDGVATDEKNQVYFFKNDAQGQKNFYKPNKDFFSNFKQWLSANAGSTTGAIAGFAKGLKSGNVYKAIGYSALGAFGGGALDYAIASQVANRENNFSDMLRHATQEGALGAVVDVAGLGLKYAGSHALKALKNTDSNIIGAVTDYIPIVGFAKRWRTGNTQAGYKGLDHAYTKDELEALSAYAREFGGDLTLKSQKPNALTQNLALKFGEDHRLTKGARFLDYLFKINDQSQAQKHFLSAIRADESGDLIGFVTQIAKESPKIQNNLRHILTTTTNNLTKRLESFGLDSLSVKDIFSNFEKGTKEEYAQAMEGVLAKVYDEKYKVVLSREGVNPKEARGIHNVTHNGKNATIIHKDLENIDEAILYASGNRYKGAKHIRIKHSKETSKQGYVTDSELASLGRDIREFLKRNEPFIDNNGARLYEWEKDGVRFRAVVNDIADMDSNPTTAMEEIITFYSDRNLKEPMRFKNPSLSHQKESYAQFRKKLESSGVLPEDSMRFLNFVESNIYNKNGVTFEQLNNALKNINSYYKQTLDPNFKSFLKQSVEGFLREDIKSGIEQIFAQNKELYKDASALFSTALSDYATMKKALKTIDRLKVRDEAKSKAQALSNIYKYLQGQGGEVSNIQNLTKGLSPEQKANFEVALLYGMFQKTLLDLGKDKVFNSRAFFENLGNLAIEFQSKEAKDFIDIARGFDTLFKNDALIAQSLGAALPKEVGSSIATSIEGAAKFQMVKMMFEALMRLMPHIPFAKGFNEKIQGMALRYHLRKALNQSSDISEFKFNLKKAGENPSINSPTRELINKITSEVNEAQDEILEKIAREEANASNEFRDTAINLKPEHIGDDPLHIQDAPRANGYDNDASTPSPSNPTDQNHSMPTQEGGRELPIQGSKQGGEGGASTGYSDAIHTGDAQNHKGLAKENTSPEIPQDLQEKWIKEFGLKSVDEEFVPSFKPEVQEALSQILGDEQIKLGKGSLVKLIREHREKYLDRIKPTLQEPDRVILQNDGAIIFARDFNEKKFFTSVARNDKGEWVITSNAPKSENGLNNKIAQGGREIYNKQAGSQINAPAPHDDVANSNTKLDSIDSTTKAPTTQTLTKQQAYHKIVGEYGKIFKKLPKVLADKDIDSILRDTKTLADIRKRSFDERGFNPSLAELAAQDYFKKEKAITAFIYKAREYGLDLGFSSFTQFFKKRYGTQIKNDEQVKDMLASLDFFKSIKIDENPQRFTDVKMSEDKSGFNSYVESKINKYLGIDEMAKKLTHNPKFDELQAMLDLYQARRITKNPKDIQKVEQYANTLRPFFPSLVNKNTSDFLYEIDNLAYYAHNLLQSKVYIDLDSNFLYPAREAIEYFLDIKPIKEFGKNYAEYFRDGQRGIAKILAEAKDYEVRKEAGKLTEAEIEQGAYKGQVAGAFYKEGLGDIDLVWGKITDAENHKGYGLAHILDKRTAEFMQEGLSEREAKAKAEAFAKNEIPNIFENGEVIKKPNEAVRIETDKYKLILKQNWEGEPTQNKWLVTAYFKKEKEPSISTDSFTKGETLPLNSKADSSTNLNQTQYDFSTKGIQKQTEELLKDFNTNNSFELKKLQERTIPAKIFERFLNTLDSQKAFFEKAKKLPKSFLKSIDTLYNETFSPPQWALEMIEKAYKSGFDTRFENNLTTPQAIMNIHSFFEAKKKFDERNIGNLVSVYKDKILYSTIDFEKEYLNGNVYRYLEPIKNTKVDSKADFSQIRKDLEEVWKRERPNDRPKVYAYDNETFNNMILRFARGDIELQGNIKPLKEFGTNYSEYFRDGQRGIAKILAEAKDYETRKAQGKLTEAEIEQGVYKGQVAGAFYKEGLGDIDLVWGNENLGLQKIINKHLDDFKVWGEGEEGVIKGLDDIVSNGELVTKNGVNTIYFYKDNREFKIGLSKGWDSKGDNNWIITAYENKPKNKGSIETSDHDTFTPKEPLSNLDKENSTTNSHNVSKAQAKKQEVLNRALTKKQEQLAKLEKQYQEAIAKEKSRPIPPPNQSNNSRRAADRALSTRIKNLLSKIEDKKNEIILLDPNASKKEKYIAQRGQTYYNAMLRAYENFTKNKEVFLDKDIFKIDLLGHGVNSNPHQLREIRNFIEHNFNITALKEFGTNYAEFYRDGQGAIAKILSEAKDYEARKEAGKLTQAEIEQGVYKGQVAGAFYKEELGDIDLVWGDSHFGLQHILERRTQDFIKEGLSEAEAKAKAREFVQSIPKIIENGKVEIIDKRAFIYYDDKKGVIALDYKGDDSRKWLLTAYKNDEVSTTSADPHQSGFADKDFSTSSKSETKADSTTNTLDLQNISLQDLQTELKTLSKDEVLDLYEQSQKLDKSGENKRNLLEAEIKERIDSQNIVSEWVESELKKYNDEYLDIPKSNGVKLNLVQHDLRSLYAIRDVLQKQEWHNKEQYQKLDTILEDIIRVKRNNAKPLHL